MNTIFGRVVPKESGAEIRDLLVVLYNTRSAAPRLMPAALFGSALKAFELRDRGHDVRTVRAETREAELTSMRVAVRCLHGELGDPDTERILIRDDTPVVIDMG